MPTAHKQGDYQNCYYTVITKKSVYDSLNSINKAEGMMLCASIRSIRRIFRHNCKAVGTFFERRESMPTAHDHGNY
jgi:hypothetical protein